MDREERIGKLDEAEGLLLRAGVLVLEAMEGTEYRVLSERTAERIRSIVSSAEDGGSIRNLRSDLAPGTGPGALWTRPLVSVKDADRRDI